VFAKSGSATELPRFLALYVSLYLAFGVQSPFLPPFLAEHGLGPDAISLVLGSATAIRLLAGPGGGWAADRLAARRFVLILCAAGAALSSMAYLPAHGLGPILIVAVLSAALLAPLGPLADALALSASALVSGSAAAFVMAMCAVPAPARSSWRPSSPAKR
jgi:PPP family 3-phenylpropionic acid transporter